MSIDFIIMVRTKLFRQGKLIEERNNKRVAPPPLEIPPEITYPLPDEVKENNNKKKEEDKQQEPPKSPDYSPTSAPASPVDYSLPSDLSEYAEDEENEGTATEEDEDLLTHEDILHIQHQKLKNREYRNNHYLKRNYVRKTDKPLTKLQIAEKKRRMRRTDQMIEFLGHNIVGIHKMKHGIFLKKLVQTQKMIRNASHYFDGIIAELKEYDMI